MWTTAVARLNAAGERASTVGGTGRSRGGASPLPRVVHKGIHMALVLASASTIRAQLLRNAGLAFDVAPARVDEDAIRAGLLAEQASPRDVADALAEAKARKSAARHPGALVLGCDQVLSHKGAVLTKPDSVQAARAQLDRLRGQTHQLLSAAVLYDDGAPVWRHVGVARLTMRQFSDAYRDDYIARNWPGLGDSVGAYKLEEEGVRLFAQITGDYFTILGVPLLELLNYLVLRGEVAG